MTTSPVRNPSLWYSPLLSQITVNARCTGGGDPWYFHYPMPNTPRRFGRLAAQFEVMAHKVTDCHNPQQRRELLKGMMDVLNQIADILMKEHSLLDSKPDSTTPTKPPPLSKAAHR
jgi:hypothetical protein